MCFQESGPARSQAGQAVAPSFAGESGILVHAFRHYHEAATLKGRHDRYAFGECPPRCAALIVTRDLAGVATSRLAMSDGRQSALAGTLIGPSLQASQTPVTSVAPVLERTIRRHGTLSGSPRRWSWMLVPHEVAV